LTATNPISRCLFGTACVSGVVGSINSGVSIFNDTIGLPALGIATGAVAGGCYLVGRKINRVARIANGAPVL